jgi:hypothetical protein
MKAKTFAVSTAVLLSMSAAANSRECTKETGFWFEAGNGDMCLPYSVGQVSIGQANVYKAAGLATGVVCLKTHLHCGWQKYLK